jgi:hypothetical protein
MKRWGWIVTLCVLCSLGFFFFAIGRTGTPTSKDCASATTCVLTYTATAGDGLLIFVMDNGTATVNTPTDNAAGGSSTYTSLFSGACNPPTGAYNCGLWIACNVKAFTTITANFSVADVGAMMVAEYTGQSTTACNDVVSTAATGTGTAMTAGTTATTAQAAELVAGAFLIDALVTITGSGAYPIVKSQQCSGCGATIGLTDQIVSSTGTFAALGTVSASSAWTGRTATIKAAAAAAGAKPHAIIF